MNRRDWLKKFGTTGFLFAASPSLISCKGFSENTVNIPRQTTTPSLARTKVAFVKTSSRTEGLKRAIELLKFKDEFKDKNIFIKPNYNSSDATPGSTHNDTLRTLMDELRGLDAGLMTIGDRSGIGDTNALLKEKDIFYIAKDAKAKTVVFDDLKEEDWQAVQYKSSYWQKGFAIPKPVLAADAVINACCLKTHAMADTLHSKIRSGLPQNVCRITAITSCANYILLQISAG